MGLGYRALFCALLLALLAITGASAEDTKAWVIVNSQEHTDVIAGAVYANEIGADYMFVLTPAHGEYLAKFFSACKQPMYYFESKRPVLTGMGDLLKNQRLQKNSPEPLSDWFAANSPNKIAVIVSKFDGSEAVSAAPYAALRKGGLHFIDPSKLTEKINALGMQGYEIIVYGSVAGSAPTNLNQVEVISTGNTYSDNRELLGKYQAIRPASTIIFASGQTFEKAMVMSGAPVALVENGTIPPELGRWLGQNRISSGLMIQGDADMAVAARSLRNDWSITLFALLAEGYSGDAQTRAAAVMPLPGSAPVHRPWVIVNSQEYTDVIAGAVYAKEIGADYMFVLTPAHGEYLAKFFSASNQPLHYFESKKPVLGRMQSMLPTGQLTARSLPSLAEWFAAQAPNKFAILLADDDGTEALSAAPYAALRGGALRFTDSAGAGRLLSGLKANGYEVMVYGTLASDLSMPYSSIDMISTGSKFSDNLEIIKRYANKKPVHNLLFASGKVFEKSMVMGGLPVALIGRTEVPPALGEWMKENGVRGGVVVQGDSDITAAVSSLKTDYGMTLFALLAEGYSGDAQTRAAAVMPLPCAQAIPRLEDVQYDAAGEAFLLRVSNIGTAELYVRAVVSLTDGRTSSSTMAKINVGEAREISVPLKTTWMAGRPVVDWVNVQIYSGTSAQNSEAVDHIAIQKVPVIRIPAGQGAGAQAAAQPAPIMVGVILLLILAGAAYLLRPKQTEAPVKTMTKKKRKR